ncbi:MAG: hypothetical protein HY691_20450 [Chloroflexi bacterium]|nr:hypothetical protein [Chloroflexota bacterium]
MPTNAFDRLGGQIRLASDRPEQPPETTVVEQVLADEILARRDGVITLGGSGGKIAVYLQAWFALDGCRLPVLAIDNHHQRPPSVLLPDRRLIGIHPLEFVALGYRHRRDELRRYPILHERYEGTFGLLRHISVYEQYALAGLGGHAYRPVSMLDYDLSVVELGRRIRRFLRHLRSSTDVRGQHEANFWTQRDEEAAEGNAAEQGLRPRIWIFFGGTGSCGAAGGPWVPYLVRREAQALGLPEPVLYGVVTGPRVYAGLHDRIEENWAATMLDLEAASTRGIDWPCIDGTTLSAAVPPYWRIFSFDDPAALEALDAVDGEMNAPKVVPEEVRTRFYAGVAKALYLAMASDALDQYEANAGNSGHRPCPWGTMVAALADACVSGLRPAVAMTRAAQALEAAAATPD